MPLAEHGLLLADDHPAIDQYLLPGRDEIDPPRILRVDHPGVDDGVVRAAGLDGFGIGVVAFGQQHGTGFDAHQRVATDLDEIVVLIHCQVADYGVATHRDGRTRAGADRDGIANLQLRCAFRRCTAIQGDARAVHRAQIDTAGKGIGGIRIAGGRGAGYHTVGRNLQRKAAQRCAQQCTAVLALGAGLHHGAVLSLSSGLSGTQG
ncbi:hypothetical protein D3C80_1264860 [compost metagenome]